MVYERHPCEPPPLIAIFKVAKYSILIYLLWFGFFIPAFSITPEELQDRFKFDERGHIVTTDYSDREHCYARQEDPIRVKHLELAKDIVEFAKNRSKKEIKGVLKNPRLVENNPQVQKCFDIKTPWDEIWLYTCGPGRWGITIAVVFSNDKCKTAFVLSLMQTSDYFDWKVKYFKTEAKELTASAIVKKFGEPNKRKKLDRIVISYLTNKKLDQEWDYRFLDLGGVLIFFTKNKCSAIAEYGILH